MKFTKLFKKVQECFNQDESTRDRKKQEELAASLDAKIQQIRDKLKNSPSKTKTLKLKKKLDILLKFKEGL